MQKLEIRLSVDSVPTLTPEQHGEVLKAASAVFEKNLETAFGYTDGMEWLYEDTVWISRTRKPVDVPADSLYVASYGA